jgi:hypothetical protein
MINEVELFVVPQEVAIEINPVEAPPGTVAVIWVELFTMNVELTPLKETEFTLIKSVPLIVTEVPVDPEEGEKLLITGGGVIVIVKRFDVAGFPVTQVTELVIWQVIWSEFIKALFEY